MKEDVLFKKAVFGGFKRAEVIEYIQQLKGNQLNHKKLLTEKDTEIQTLEDENALLKEKVRMFQDNLMKADKVCTEFERQIHVLKEKIGTVEDKYQQAFADVEDDYKRIRNDLQKTQAKLELLNTEESRAAAGVLNEILLEMK